MNTATQQRDAGMAQALGHAERVEPQWGALAYSSLKFYAEIEGPDQFIAADFIQWAHKFDELPEPPTPKAFGSIFTKAAKNGLIRKVGYRPHPLRHASPTVLWEVV